VAQKTRQLHESNHDVAFDPRVDLYLDFQIKLDLDLQATVLLADLGRPVRDPRLVHGDDAAATAVGAELCGGLRGWTVLLLRHGRGLVGAGGSGGRGAGALLEGLAELGGLAGATRAWVRGHANFHVGLASVFRDLAG
jgi:hypothetical protein